MLHCPLRFWGHSLPWGKREWVGSPHARGPGSYLLQRRVLDGVSVVVVVDDIHVAHRVPLRRPRKLDIQFAFAGSFGVDREVGGFAELDT